MTTYRTPHDLAHMMRQSEETARRVLREVWPDRDAPVDWELGESEWSRVLRHLARNQTRRFGCRRRRNKQKKTDTNEPLMTDSATT